MRKAFSLIEILLYVALIVIMMSALLPVALQIINSGTKSGVTQEVYQSARYVSERIKYEIRNASGINIASSTFNLNLATTTNAGLYLIGYTSSTNPTIISVATGTIRIQQGTSTPIFLHSFDAQAASLIFSNYSTSTYNNVGFTLTMTDASTSTRQEYNASTTLITSVELRNK
jgi:type II secretory pathway pseudopilin PulG